MRAVEDAVILAGGKGTRMLPSSLYMPKETMPLVDTPILNHLIWEAARAGVKRVHLVLSQRKLEILDPFLSDVSIHDNEVRPDLPIHALSLGVPGVQIIPHLQDSANGVADAVKQALSDINGPFLVILGDMLILQKHLPPNSSGPKTASTASKKLVERYNENGLPCLGLFPVELREVVNYGIANLDRNMVVEIEEKPLESQAASNLALCGRYLLPEETGDILEKYPLSKYGDLQSIYLLRHFIEYGGLNGVVYNSPSSMYDSGNPLVWLKSQIDHALQREDFKGNLSSWLSEKLEKMGEESYH